MLSWMGRTTLEVIGQAGLGYSFDPLTEDRPDDFATAVKDFLCVWMLLSDCFHMLKFHALSPPHGHYSPQLVQSIIPRLLLPYVYRIGTKTFQRQVLSAVPSHNVQRLKEIADVMHERSVLIFNEKKAALEKGDDALKLQVGEGRDVMSILRKSNFADGARRARARIGRQPSPGVVLTFRGSTGEHAGIRIG